MHDLRGVVVDDPVLRQRLLGTPDRQAFIAGVVDVARDCGIDLSADEVAEAMAAEWRRHLERWL